MGFLDKAKSAAETATSKAKEGIGDVQTKRELGQAYDELGKIAFDLKFASEAHFGRVFRAAFGCTPGQTRNLEQFVRVSQTGGGQQLNSEPVYIDWVRRLAVRDR